MAYLLTKNEKGNKIIYSNDCLEDGYRFHPKNKIRVSHVVVVDPKMIDEILSIKFKEKFKKLVKLAKYVLESDEATTSDTSLVLDEVALLRSILLNKYQKFLKKEKEELFMSELRAIENNARMKQVYLLNKMYYYEMEEEKGKSR